MRGGLRGEGVGVRRKLLVGEGIRGDVHMRVVEHFAYFRRGIGGG